MASNAGRGHAEGGFCLDFLLEEPSKSIGTWSTSFEGLLRGMVVVVDGKKQTS